MFLQMQEILKGKKILKIKFNLKKHGQKEQLNSDISDNSNEHNYQLN